MNRLQTRQHLRRLRFLIIVAIFAPAVLACGFLQIGPESVSGRIVIRNRLPTLTPTPRPTQAPISQVSPISQFATPTEAPASAAFAPPLTAEPPNNNNLTPDISAASPPPTAAGASTQAVISSPVAIAGIANTPAATISAVPEQNSPAVPTPVPSPTPPAPPTPELETAGWVFTGVQLVPDQDQESLILYGDMVNNTGLAQELSVLTGTFYDAQGQVIADENQTVDYWPTDIIPPGGRVPFELSIGVIQNPADFNLNVEAEPSSTSPREDFEFLNLNQWTEAEVYCLAGSVRNPNGPLQDYLVIAAVLFDGQDNVVKFGDEFEAGPGLDNGGTLDFEICMDLAAQNVARYELRAWGQ